jgi:hypothetical protein
LPGGPGTSALRTLLIVLAVAAAIAAGAWLFLHYLVLD